MVLSKPEIALSCVKALLAVDMFVPINLSLEMYYAID